MEQFAREHDWEKAITDFNRRTLHALLSWLGAAAPIHESDVKAVGALAANHGARRTMQFLTAHDLRIPDATRPRNVDQDVIEQQVAALPAPLAREIRAWIAVLRGEGRRPSPPMAWDGIRYNLLPVVTAWSQQITSLRTITTDDIHIVLKDRHASNARDLPSTTSADRLQGLIDRAPTILARVVVALVAIHALRESEVRACGWPTSTVPRDASLSAATMALAASFSTSSLCGSSTTGSGNEPAAGPTPPTPTCWSASKAAPTPPARR